MAEIVTISWGSIRRLLFRPRFWVSLVLALSCVLIAYFQVPAYLSAHGYQVQVSEPFQILLPGRFPQILLLISFLLLVGDVPFLYSGLEFTVTRSSRNRWFAGQILAAQGVAVLWLLFVLACTILVFSCHMSFQNDWSRFLKAVVRVPGAAAAVGLNLVSPTANMIIGMSPYTSFVWSFLFQLLLFWSMTFWSVAFNLWTKRSYGCMITVSFWVLRRVVSELGVYLQKDFSFISPMSLVNLGENKLTTARTVYIILFFLTQICVLWFFSASRLRNSDLSKAG